MIAEGIGEIAGDHSDSILQVSVSGILLLSFGKILDSLSTIVTLSVVPGTVERNPMIRALIGEFGVTSALALVSLVSILGIAIVTESGAFTVRKRSPPFDESASVIHLVGYGIPTIIFLATAVHNTIILARFIQPF